MTFLAHAVKRGLEYYSASSSLAKRDNGHRSEDDEIVNAFLSLGGGVVILTVVLFLFAVVAMDYALQVVSTLAMIETPSSAITVTPASDDIALKSADQEAKEGLLEAQAGPNITLVAQKPITAKIRTTVRHLKSQAGRAAPWRGYMSYLVYSNSFVFVSSVLEAILPRFPGALVIISAATGALLAQVHVAWTHKVVAMPSSSRFWQRFVSVSDWKALALPAAIQASAVYITIYIVNGFVLLFGLDRPHQKEPENAGQAACLILQGLAVPVILVVCALFFCLPASVTLTRVESSVLPEDQETIVPFDRTFDGKVIPRIHGGSGRVGFVDAWKSFNWESRRRLIKLFFKAVAIGFALAFIFAQVIVLEIWAFMGTAFLAQVARKNHDLHTNAY